MKNVHSDVDFDGKKYREGAELQRRLGNGILADLHFRGDEKILDLGCGDGSLTARIAECVPEGVVLGIDSSEGMIQTARELEGDNLEFTMMDIYDFNFDNEFDIIFSNAALHWVYNHEKVLENCYKALKPGGFLRFNFAAAGNCHNLNLVLKEVIAKPEFNNYFVDFVWPWYMPELSKYQEIVERFKYKDVQIWPQNADKYFDTEEELITWIEQPCIVPFLKMIDNPEGQKSFRDIVVKKMKERTKQADGRYFEKFRRINLKCTK